MGDVDHRVLVLAPRGRDAMVIANTLNDLETCPCADIGEVVNELRRGVGTLVVTEESLVDQSLEAFATWLGDQPPWSDLPVVVLSAQRLGPRPAAAQKAISDLGNIIILERPLHGQTLRQAVSSALRARGRQYVARQHLEERRRFASTLSQRIKERTAELAEANARLMREIEEKERMHGFLVQSQKMEAVGQLTGGVAHDFNNLLTIIRSSVDFLSREDISAQRRARYVDAIGQTVDRAARLTGQLLAFARRQALVPVEFDVCAQVETVAELVRPLVGSRIVIEVETPPTPCYTLADLNQFETALINLAVNARDAMQDHGRLRLSVALCTEIPAVRGHAGGKGSFVVVTVEDSGRGIPADILPKIFDPFFTTKDVGKGTGLGLSQVFGFAKQSGGEITVQSQEGSGAVFQLYLPRTGGQAIQAEPGPSSHDKLRSSRTGLRVLVVEDNDTVGQFAVEMLSDLGHRPERARNAEAALAELGDDGGGFDAVFSDVMMPGMNGLAMAQVLRSRFASLPILLTSGYSHIIAEEGTHGFELLKKPYSVEALAERLQQVVAGH